MRGGARFWLAIGALVVLHFFLHLALGVGREAPDLLTLAVLLGARSGGLGVGAALGFGLGLLEDAFSILAFGANTVALTVVGTLGALTRDFFVGESMVFAFAYLVVGKWLRDFVQWLVFDDTVREPFVQRMIVESGPAALYMAAVGIVVVVAMAGSFEEARA